jgi:hypothetical protein
MMTPSAFEKMVEKLKENERPKLQIFKWSNDLLTNFEVVDKKEKSSIAPCAARERGIKLFIETFRRNLTGSQSCPTKISHQTEVSLA